ncbi:MAG: hypothetical protein ACEQSX_19750 [Baekduiaceae bacterium]
MTLSERCDNFIRQALLGEEVYRVGGSVRDELLLRRCKDNDYVVRGLAAPALDRKLRAAGAKTSPLRLRGQGPLIGVRAQVKGLGLIEICLPRTEVSTGAGRHDFEILVDPSLPLADDAERRDFTINALYKRVGEFPDVIDPTGRGLYDLQHRFLNTTHPDSFRDDPLRILRALRFVSVLGYDLGTQTLAQMSEHSHAVNGLTQKGVSGTAFDELCKLLMGADVARALRIARDTGTLAVLLPELEDMLGFEQDSRYHDLTTDEHTFTALETAAAADASLRVRLGLLFHDCGKPSAAWVGDDGRQHFYGKTHVEPTSGESYTTLDHEVYSARRWDTAAKRLNVPRALRSDVRTLVADHMVSTRSRVTPARIGRMRAKYGDGLLKDLLLHRACDISGKGEGATAADIRKLGQMEALRVNLAAGNVPASVKDLKIAGFDLQALGASGPDIGRVLREVLDEVISQPDPLRMSREWQIEAAERLS